MGRVEVRDHEKMGKKGRDRTTGREVPTSCGFLLTRRGRGLESEGSI